MTRFLFIPIYTTIILNWPECKMKMGLVVQYSMKKAVLVLCGLFLIGAVQAATPKDLIKDGTVIYELPYAGITPENPLYFFKQLRDQIREFLTRDYIQKAEFLLVSSDKRAHIAIILAEKGKTRQSVEVLADAEERALRISPLLSSSKKQGISANEQFIYTLKLSNTKHREIIQEIAKMLPQGQDEEILNALIDLNQRVADELSRL